MNTKLGSIGGGLIGVGIGGLVLSFILQQRINEMIFPSDQIVGLFNLALYGGIIALIAGVIAIIAYIPEAQKAIRKEKEEKEKNEK